MFSMLSVLLGTTATSWALLWFAVPVDWLQLSPTAVLSLHLLPPLLLTSAYQWWQRVQQLRQVQAEQAEALAEQAEQAQAEQAARQQQQAVLASRREAVDCRWLRVLTHGSDNPPAWLDEPDVLPYWEASLPDERDGSLLDYLAPAAIEAWQALYVELPGAACLPLLLQASRQVNGMEYMQQVRAWQQMAWQQAWPGRTQPLADCRFLADGVAIPDQVLACLQQDPALPGVLVLAADAPALFAGEEDDSDSAIWPVRAQGVPGAALVLAVLMRTDLPAPELLAAEPGGDADPYQPYWERPLAVTGQAVWGAVPEADQAAFARQALHVRLAQSARAALPQQGTLPLTRTLQTLLDDALINGGVLDDCPPQQADSPAAGSLPAPGWLVHNSGELAAGGVRLAAIASNLSRREIDLHPIDQASHTVRDWGDTGQAASLLQLAVTVLQGHRLQMPVLQVHFDDEEVAVSVAYPVTDKEPT